MRGLASLEKDRSQGPEASTATEKRSRELEEKTRLPSSSKNTPDLVLGLPDRPQPPNLSKTTDKSKEVEEEETPLASCKNSSADTFAEQTGGTVRKRVSAHIAALAEPVKTLPGSTSTGADGGGSDSTAKSTATVNTNRWTARKPSPQTTEGEDGREKVMSKSFVNENKAPTPEKSVTTGSANDSPLPIKRGSIAARVAAFEASSNTATTNATPARPNWLRKA